MGKELDTTVNDTTQEKETQEVETPADKEQVSQISEMLSGFGMSEDKKDKEPEGETGDVPPSEDSPDGEPESEEPPSESPQDKRIEELEAQVKTLMEKLSEKPAEKEEQPTEVDEESYFKNRLDEIQKDLTAEYISEDEYEAIFEKREKLNEVLKKVQNDTIQGMLRSIPKIIAVLVPQHVTFYQKTAEFYKSNPDLYEHRKTVGSVIDELSAKNPSWSMDKLLEEVGGKSGDASSIGEVRKRLGLKKQAIKAAEKDNVRRPSFAKPAHVKNPSEKEAKLTGVQKEIVDMLDSIK